MIVRSKTGVMVSGTISKDPEIKTLGGKDVLVLNVKAHSEKDASGNWKSLFIDVQCWNALSERDGMYQKGDFIIASGRELRDREYPEGSGKFYYSLSADGVCPGDLSVIRWMQQIVDMIPESQSEMTPVSGPTPFDAANQAEPAPVQTSLENAPIAADDDDLPF